MKTDFLTTLPEDWIPAASVFAALGDPARQKILLLFEPREELSIKDIVDVFPLSRTGIVHHLSVLERAGILRSRRQGKSALYSLRVATVMDALNALRQYILEEFSESLEQEKNR